MDSAGNVHIADTGNNRLRKVTLGGAVDTVAATLSAPTGLAFDSSGNLYIAESTAYRLSRMTPDGTTPDAGTGFNTVTAAPVPHALNELDDPVAVAADPFGSVYIADLTGQPQRVTRNCALSRPYFGQVSGVASDAQENIYFSDPQHSVVWKLPAAPPPAGNVASPSLAYAAFVDAANLLTFDARFTSRHCRMRRSTAPQPERSCASAVCAWAPSTPLWRHAIPPACGGHQPGHVAQLARQFSRAAPS